MRLRRRIMWGGQRANLLALQSLLRQGVPIKVFALNIIIKNKKSSLGAICIFGYCSLETLLNRAFV